MTESVSGQVISALTPHPAIGSMSLIGSRARGEATELSDWDFIVETRDFQAVAQALPALVAVLEPLAEQWDRLSPHACYMLLLRGVGKVDLIFEPHEPEPPWVVSAETLRGIDDHFWDWRIWLAAKDRAGIREMVGSELAKMHEHLLAPLGVAGIPSSVRDAVVAYTEARTKAEARLGIAVPRTVEDQVRGLLARVGMQSKSPIRAVFFDLDDTLCDSIGTREARARLAFETISRERPELVRDAFVARVMETTGDRIVRGVPAVVEELGLGGSEAGGEAIGVWFFEGCIGLLRAFEGVAETVERLRDDYGLGVITNGDVKAQRSKWPRLNLGIELVVISGECGFEKPDPRIFADALSLAGGRGRRVSVRRGPAGRGYRRGEGGGDAGCVVQPLGWVA